MSFTWNSAPFPKESSWSVVHTCVSRRKFLLPCPEPPLISGAPGDCGQWRRNYRPGPPSKRTNAVLPITSWQVSDIRVGLGLSRSHHFVRLRADHRIAFAGAVFETVAVEDFDMSARVPDQPACCTAWASIETVFLRTPSMWERNSWVRLNVSLPIMSCDCKSQRQS